MLPEPKAGWLQTGHSQDSGLSSIGICKRKVTQDKQTTNKNGYFIHATFKEYLIPCYFIHATFKEYLIPWTDIRGPPRRLRRRVENPADPVGLGQEGPVHEAEGHANSEPGTKYVEQNIEHRIKLNDAKGHAHSEPETKYLGIEPTKYRTDAV